MNYSWKYEYISLQYIVIKKKKKKGLFFTFFTLDYLHSLYVGMFIIWNEKYYNIYIYLLTAFPP